MTNQEVAKILRQVAAAYLLKGENRFKVIAYEKAADIVAKSGIEVEDLWEEKKLTSLSGIGKSIALHLDELFRTGKVRHFEKILAGLPPAMFPLLEVPGFGPKRAYRLVSELKLTNPKTVVDDLLKEARREKIALLPGFGKKSQAEIIEALKRFKEGRRKEKRLPLYYAAIIAESLIGYLKKHPDCQEAFPLGSLRRQVATVGDIDIAVSTLFPRKIIDWFLDYPKKERVLEKGESGASILLRNGQQVDLRVSSPHRFGAMLQYFTGSKQHNIHLRELALKKGLSLSEYGIKPVSKKQKIKSKKRNYNEKLKIYEFAKEEDFYAALGLSWIPPELREDRGEIEAALKHLLPSLVEEKDIKGDLHLHSSYDTETAHDLGNSSLEEIMETAEKLGYEYVGLSEHNPSISRHSQNQIVEILKRRRLYLEQKISSTKFVRVKLFIMLEVDILPDGKLAVPFAAFDFLDAMIVSIHSSFEMDKKKMTERIIAGLSHPKAKILAHPTGRLLGERKGYEADWWRILKFCRTKKKALEINAYPQRLDLPENLVREAVKEKVKLVINTDSHHHHQMEWRKYGVAVARRGWAEKNDILNTLPYNRLKAWLLEE